MKYIKLFKDTLDVFSELSDEQAGQIWKAIINYSSDKDVELEGLLSVILIPFKQQIDRSKAEYAEVCERNKRNGASGGRVASTRGKSNPSKPTQSQDKDKDKDINIYEDFIFILKSKASIKSKVTITKDGKKLFKDIEDKNKLLSDYVSHQINKGSFAQRVTAFMEDYNHSSTGDIQKTFSGDEIDMSRFS